jgi:hypothetical protein
MLKPKLWICSGLLLVLLGACGVNTSQESSIAQITDPSTQSEPTSPPARETSELALPNEAETSQETVPPLPSEAEAHQETATPLPSKATEEPNETPSYAIESTAFPEQAVEPPAEVAAELPLAMGGSLYGCQALPDDSLGLQMTIYEPVYEQAQGFTICFSGFQIDQPIDLTILYPDGTSEEKQVAPHAPFGPEALDWMAYPNAPLGEYRVIARQGDATAQGEFSLRPATEPRFTMLPYSGSESATLPVVLAGFEPFSQQVISLYRNENGTWRYYAHVMSATIDAHGSFQLNLYTSASTPKGYYRLMVSNLPPHAYPVEFTLE